MKRWILALASLTTVLALIVVFPTVASGQNSKGEKRIERTGPKYVPGEVMVKFRPGVKSEAMYAAHAAVKAQVLRRFHNLPGLERVRVPKDMSVEQAVTIYQRNPNVLRAHPNYIWREYDVPDDPQFSEQWGLNNTGQTGGLPDADIDAPEAWNLTYGSNDVVVAVIDSGVYYGHPDLAANIWENSQECSGVIGIDDDGNGYIDDCHGIDVYNNDSDPMDDRGHGTHVAGIIGAVGNNSVGVAGVNWNTKIMACKFLDNAGHGSSAGFIECLEYVADMKDRGVNIVAVNLSVGGGGADPDVASAIDSLRQRGILAIAAAGNGDLLGNGINLDESPAYPASFFLPNIISVAATTSADAITIFSNYGRRTVHLGAPGEDILSTMAPGSTIALLPACPLAGDLYCSLDGTSMATPFVAGVTALLKASNPTLDWRAIKNLILAGGDNVSSLAGKTVTEKRLNANGSLTCTNSVVSSRLQPVGDQTTTAVGDPLALAALNINCAQPNGEMQVSVNGGESVVTLQDVGSGSDQAEGDGIYSGQFIASALGTYTLGFPGGDTVTVNTVRNYQYVQVPFNYEEITGTNWNLGDDVSVCSTMPSQYFPISFGGQLHSKICVGSNGVINFEDHFNPYDNSAVPVSSISSLVAPFWDDLVPSAGTDHNVFWSVIGSAPNRELVIEWRDVDIYGCTAAGGVTFQVVFLENKDDILFNYKDATFGGTCSVEDNGGSATVGVQVSQNAGTQYSFNTASLTDNMSIRWTTGSLSVAPSSLDFGNVLVRATSPAKTITLNNQGGSSITISSIVPSGDFAKLNDTCTGSLAANTTCTVDVTFTPTTTGARSGTLQVTTDSPGNSGSVGLTGWGTDFSVGIAPDSSDSVTVNAGQTALYNLNIGPVEGFQGSTALTCTWKSAQPRATSCTVSPATVNVNGNDPALATVSITTTARSMASVALRPQPPAPNSYPVSHLAIWLLVLAALASVALRQRRAIVVLGSVLFLVVLWVACGGSPPPPPVQPKGTQAGTYQLTVTAASSGMSHSTDLTLTVN
jgi:subtilisin family serine protease